MALPERFAATLERLGLTDGTIVLAVSGGPDSLALLELAAVVAPSLGVSPLVAHFDHGIHAGSRTVAAAVQAHAARHHFPFRTEAGRLGPAASETRARVARREWLEHLAAEVAGPVLTGHHRDDQVETVLMRFLEGSGPLGLAGMAEVQGVWVHPLLAEGRADLADFLTERRVVPWNDPANTDDRHLRNWVRSTMLSAIAARLPRFEDNLLAARDAFDENRSAWEDIGSVLPGLDLVIESDGASVAADGLAGYSSAVVRGVLRSIGRRCDLAIGHRELDRMQALIRKGHTGQRVDLNGGAGAALSFGRLRLFRPVAHPECYDVSVPTTPGQMSLDGWQFEMAPSPGPAALERVSYSTWIPAGSTTRIRNWRSGDRIRPLGGRGSRLVVRCMQDIKVSRHLRPSWPVVEIGGQVIWVPGVCRGDAAVPGPGTDAVRIDARPC